MRNAVILLSMAILSPSLSNAQDFWQQSNGLYIGYIGFLAINSSEHIFAGTYYGGVFRSTDNGDNWTPIGLTYNWVVSLAINSSGHIFAGTAGGGVYRSIQSTTAVKEINEEIPSSFELRQNYPSPFNAATKLVYSIHNRR